MGRLPEMLILCFAITLLGPAKGMAQDAEYNRKIQVQPEDKDAYSGSDEDSLSIAGEEAQPEILRNTNSTEEEYRGLKEDEKTAANERKGRVLEEMPLKEVPPAEDEIRYRAFLGVYYNALSPEEALFLGFKTHHGAFVNEIIAGTGAEEAGLQRGDLIIGIDDKPINASNDIRKIIADYHAGQSVKVTFIRNGRQQSVMATLGKKAYFETQLLGRENGFRWDFNPGSDNWDLNLNESLNNFFDQRRALAEKPFLGVYLEDVDNLLGARVTGVIPNTAAGQMGLAKGDVITGLNGKSIKSLAHLQDMLSQLEVGDEISIAYLRGGRLRKASAPLGSSRNTSELKIERYDEDPRPTLRPAKEKEVAKEGSGISIEERDKLKKSNQIDDLRMFLNGASPGSELDEDLSLLITMRDLSGEERRLLPAEVSAGNELQVQGLLLTPVPGRGLFEVSFRLAQKGNTTIALYDRYGSEVFAEAKQGFRGEYRRSLNISFKAGEVYFLLVRQNGQSFCKKMLIQ